jgi:hypothetical protein
MLVAHNSNAFFIEIDSCIEIAFHPEHAGPSNPNMSKCMSLHQLGVSSVDSRIEQAPYR